MFRLASRFAALLLVLTTVAPCWAQAAAAESTEKSYVTSYFLVGLGIALGLAAILARPSKRRKEVRRPE